MTSTVQFLRFTWALVEAGAVTRPLSSETGEPDAVPTEDPFGRPTLPGTSVAGALRAWVKRCYGSDVATSWFGPEPSARGTDDVPTASEVWVLGVEPLGEPAGFVDRRRTGVSRVRGAADNRTLRFDRLLEPGSTFEVFCRLGESVDRQSLAEAIARWDPTLGRGVMSGQGRFEISEVRHGALDLTTELGLEQWLTLNGPRLVRTVATEPVSVQPDPSGRRIVVPITVVGPVHIGTGETVEVDGREVAPTWRLGSAPTIPGSTWRGVFRSRMELILRSCGGAKPCLNAACGTCWACKVFGHGGGDDESTAVVGRRGRLRFVDSTVEAADLRRRVHVAIDRFTGGARDGLLYKVEGIESGTSTLEIEIATDLGEDDTRLAQALIRLVLKDLDDGIIGVGGHVTRGYGGIRCDLAAAEDDGALPSEAEAQAELATRLAQGETV